ncbi:unnamed protein product, partial [Closterium sp. NIES-54]
MTLCPSTAPQRVPLPSPPASSLPAGPDPTCDSLRAVSPAVTRVLATAVTDPLFESTTASALVFELVDFAAACRLDYATSLVAESASVCPPSVGGECALGTDVLEDRQKYFECFSAASPHLVSMLLASKGDPDALNIPTPRSYAEAIEGPYSSQWQAAMDAEMASWKSTSTYVDEVPPPGANIFSGMWIFRVKRPPGSPPAFKARYVARGFSQRQGVDFFQTFSPTPKMTTLRVLLHVASQRDYELHSLDFSTAFLQGSLHEEIWLRRPPRFTGSFPAGTQWSLRGPVYGLRQAPREWHDTLRTTLAALGFAPSTSNPSLFLRTDTTLPPFFVLVYVDDLVFATTDTEALAHVKSEQQKRHTCTDLGQPRVVLTGHADASWVDDLTTQRSSQGYTFSLGSGSVSWRSTRSSSVLSSSCEAEIYAGAMAAQELRGLTYLLTDLGEAPRSPPILLGGDFVIHPELALPFLTEPLGAVSTTAGPEERVGRGAGGSGEAQAQGQPRDSAVAPMQPSLGPPSVFGLDKFNGDNFTEWSFKMENIFDHYDLLEVMEGTEKRPENDPEKSPWDFRRRELASADGAGAASIGRGYGRGRGRGRGGSRFGSNSFNGGRGSGRYGSDNKSYGRGQGRFDGQEGRGAGGGRGRGRGGRGGRGGGAANMKSAGNESESRDDRFPCQFFFVSTQAPAGPEKDEGFVEPAAVGKATLHSLDYWVIDSGATYSMTPRADLLTELEPSPVKHVTSALGQRAEVKGMGKAMFKGADGKMVGLKNVLWVPNLAANLISVQRLQKAGMDTSSKGAKTYTARLVAKKQHKGEENPKAAAEEEYGESMWGSIASAAFSNPTSATGECDWLTLHRRMGHVALPILQQLVKNEMVAGIRVKGEPDEVLGCPTCMQAKFTHYPFSSSEATAKAPLDEVVMDVVAPLKLGAAGAEYFLTIVDVYTRMTWVYVLSKKSDVAETVKTDWLPMVERQQDRLKNGIRHSLTMSYSPAMNGIAEQANWTITETARGLLIEAGLPDYFLPDAVQSACVAKNRSLTHVGADKWVPYVEWIGRKPKVDMLRVFGDCKFMENLMYKDWKAENEAKIGMRFGEVKSSGLELVELPLELSSSTTTTRQSSLVNGGAEARDAEEEEEEVQEVSERAPTLPSRTTSAPWIRVTPQQRHESLHGKPAMSALAGVAMMVGDDDESEYEECAFTFFSPVEMPGEPATLKEALESSDAEEWKKAMESELKSIEENGTWEL